LNTRVMIVRSLVCALTLGSTAVYAEVPAPQDRDYTPGTLQIVDTLQRPLKLTLYFSDHATRDRQNADHDRHPGPESDVLQPGVERRPPASHPPDDTDLYP